MQIEVVMKDVNEIIPYWRNPRRNEATIDALAEDIEKNGFNVPIVIDKNNVIVKGHARLRAAKKLGMDKVPCIVSNADEDVIRADRIADNKIQELSAWDFGKLNVELDRIGEKMSFGRLFRPEDVKPIEEDIQLAQEIEFRPVGIDGEGFSFEDVLPKSAAIKMQTPIHSNSEMPQKDYVDYENEKPQKRKLKTLCPYCGKVVVLNV